jgi:hypothetical protein
LIRGHHLDSVPGSDGAAPVTHHSAKQEGPFVKRDLGHHDGNVSIKSRVERPVYQRVRDHDAAT